ncbi:hypothetical protein [Nocardiopsis halotolerans]|uniref:hypothetical protein n=1 Tax=Nocardiopsis halotolerans TaxID=124252 RepID=UPI0023A917BC|nr:hypothetical protein [Nocardiopsis halotolerans]
MAEHAPYDRIQFTVGAGDVPVKLLDQLALGGRLVLPLRIRGSISRSSAFERLSIPSSQSPLSKYEPLEI